MLRQRCERAILCIIQEDPKIHNPNHHTKYTEMQRFIEILRNKQNMT